MTSFISRRLAWLIVALSLAWIHHGQAAEPVALFLTMNGVQIRGDSSRTSLGRENSIECWSFESEFFRQNGAPAVHRPIKILKRIDKASPLIADAFGKIQTGSAEFRFYRPNPSGDGTTENFLRVELANVRISSVRLIITNSAIPANATDAPMEEVTLTYSSYRIIYTNGGAEAVLDVNKQ